MSSWTEWVKPEVVAQVVKGLREQPWVVSCEYPPQVLRERVVCSEALCLQLQELSRADEQTSEYAQSLCRLSVSLAAEAVFPGSGVTLFGLSGNTLPGLLWSRLGQNFLSKSPEILTIRACALEAVCQFLEGVSHD